MQLVPFVLPPKQYAECPTGHVIEHRVPAHAAGTFAGVVQVDPAACVLGVPMHRQLVPLRQFETMAEQYEAWPVGHAIEQRLVPHAGGFGGDVHDDDDGKVAAVPMHWQLALPRQLDGGGEQ
jgi:hypothetical protein